MGAGPFTYFTASMASGSSVSSNIDLGLSWHQVWVEIPTMASGSDIYFQASSDNSTYRRMYHNPTIGNSSPGALYVTSGITNCLLNLGEMHARYMRIQLSSATTDTPYTFRFVTAGEFT